MPIPIYSSPQSKVLNGIRSTRVLLEAQVSTQNGVVLQPPRIVTANGEALPRAPKAAFRIIQNCGIVPVKYLCDPENSCTADMFHGILAPGNAVDDGLGSLINFTITGERVTILGVGGNPRVCTFIGLNQGRR